MSIPVLWIRLVLRKKPTRWLFLVIWVTLKQLTTMGKRRHMIVKEPWVADENVIPNITLICIYGYGSMFIEGTMCNMYMLFEKLDMSCACTLTTTHRLFIRNHKVDLMLGCSKKLVIMQESWGDQIYFGTCIN